MEFVDCEPQSKQCSQYPAVRSNSALQNLPVELVHQITELLAPVALTSLGHTCRYFRTSIDRSSMTDSVRPRDYDGRPRRPWESEHEKLFREECLEILCMLERDGKIPADRLICSQCITTHSKAMFSQVSLTACSLQRKCLGHTGRVWICPHLVFSHEQIYGDRFSAFREVMRNYRGCRTCGWNIYSDGFRSFIAFAVVSIFEDSDLDDDKVVAVLGALDATICPHLRLSDPFVSSLYHRECGLIKRPGKARNYHCNCRAGAMRHLCPTCSAQINFMIHDSFSGPSTLNIVVSRNFAHSHVASADWKSQIAQPDELEAVERGWSHTVRHANRLEELKGDCPHGPPSRCFVLHTLIKNNFGDFEIGMFQSPHVHP